jgi:alpha-beta hydrolase superfamily lysophospholipase
MTNTGRWILRLTTTGLLAGVVVFGIRTRSEAHRLVTNPRDIRPVAAITPADRQLPFEPVMVTTADGLHLSGWFIPGVDRATVMTVHGYKDQRASLLGVAAILHRHGFSVLITSLRGHDINDGELITFGLQETKDLAAWHAYLQSRTDIDHDNVGIYGASMGGFVAIRFASMNPRVRALVADSAFSSASDTVATSVRFFTGLPPFPFAPAILFWMEREIGGTASDLDAKQWIGRIAPRPVLLMQGGADVVVSPDSGARLFAAAGQPKELWFDPEVGHAEFLRMRPAEFERRVSGFFAKYLTSVAARSVR